MIFSVWWKKNYSKNWVTERLKSKEVLVNLVPRITMFNCCGYSVSLPFSEKSLNSLTQSHQPIQPIHYFLFLFLCINIPFNRLFNIHQYSSNIFSFGFFVFVNSASCSSLLFWRAFLFQCIEMRKRTTTQTSSFLSLLGLPYFSHKLSFLLYLLISLGIIKV